MSRSIVDYRPEITGLRAFAIVMVLLYHIEHYLFSDSDFFSGGFIGVDIFFIISGYLIGRKIINENLTVNLGKYLTFVQMRFLRLFPALFFMVLFTTILAWNLLLPKELIEYIRDLNSALFFISNSVFALENFQYGVDQNKVSPLLHTWSLSLEMQFYILMPILLRYMKISLLPFLVLVLCFVCYLFTIIDPLNSFYALLSRSWEFLAGVAIASFDSKRIPISPRKSGYLAILGLIGILLSFGFFSLKSNHPGLITLIPVLSCASFIIFSRSDNGVGLLCGNKFCIYLGTRSYSLYLWHFPIIIFFGKIQQDVNAISLFILIGIIVFVSLISYELFERSFKKIFSVYLSSFIFMMFLSFGGSILTFKLII